MVARDEKGPELTPFDEVIEAIRDAGYHTPRREEHSNLVCSGIFRNLLNCCPEIAKDYQSGQVREWSNVSAPGARGRKIDLFIGEPGADDQLDSDGARICVENKSVITAHRNKTNRLDDLDEVVRGIHRVKPECIVVATVLVGVAENVLNIPDHVKKIYKAKPGHFEREVLPRLSTGDETLWREFEFAVSHNRKDDPRKTINAFRRLPTRAPGHTHALGYDFMLLVPVYIDNVNPPRIDRDNEFGIDVDKDYRNMLETICQAYVARWHL